MKKINNADRAAIMAEVKKALQEGVDKLAKKKHAISESNVDIKSALVPIAGMTSQEIADLVEPVLAKDIMNEADKVDTNTIKKLVYKALTGLGITTSLTSIVYTTLLSSPKTGPVVEKIINGTLSPDASLIAGIIGIVLGGLVTSVGIDAKRGMKEKLDELSPELRKKAFDAGKARFDATSDDDFINKDIYRRQADRFATHITPAVEEKVKSLADQAGLSVELTKGVDFNDNPFVQLFFLGKRQGTVSQYNTLFSLYVTKDGYKLKDKENIPNEALKLLQSIIRLIQTQELPATPKKLPGGVEL